MKVYAVNRSDRVGGAARAAYRIYQAVGQAGIDSHMFVDLAYSGDWAVHGPSNKIAEVGAIFRPLLGGLLTKTLITDNPALHSPACIPSMWPKQINASDADLVHLHWVNEEMLSVGDVRRIDKPVVWTLHDMWAFCGAEHTTEDVRWRDGYTRNSRPVGERGFDLNRWVWRRKSKAWRKPMHIVAPSTWLAECVRQSALMSEWPIAVVPNPIDTDVWQPVEKQLARNLFGLPVDGPLLLFGAMDGCKNPMKGFDLLQQALLYLRGQIQNLQLVVFGQQAHAASEKLCYPVHFVGHLHDDLSLRVLYSAADVMVNPSRQEAFGQTASEANACGTPAVGFDNSGLVEIISHKRNGYLAKAFDPEDLAAGIFWLLEDRQRFVQLSAAARQDAISRFSYPVVARQYLQVYENAMK